MDRIKNELKAASRNVYTLQTGGAELWEAINILRAYCNAEIKRLNSRPCSDFEPTNKFLKECDKLFKVQDKVNENNPRKPRSHCDECKR